MSCHIIFHEIWTLRWIFFHIQSQTSLRQLFTDIFQEIQTIIKFQSMNQFERKWYQRRGRVYFKCTSNVSSIGRAPNSRDTEARIFRNFNTDTHTHTVPKYTHFSWITFLYVSHHFECPDMKISKKNAWKQSFLHEEAKELITCLFILFINSLKTFRHYYYRKWIFLTSLIWLIFFFFQSFLLYREIPQC